MIYVGIFYAFYCILHRIRNLKWTGNDKQNYFYRHHYLSGHKGIRKLELPLRKGHDAKKGTNRKENPEKLHF